MANTVFAPIHNVRKDLSAEYIRKILDYDPESGIFRWKKRQDKLNRWNTGYSGKPAGCLNCDGYHVIRIDDKLYLSHRLAWLWVHGEWPEDQVDHRDVDRANPKIANLRKADNMRNNFNCPIRKSNTSGCKGVSLCKRNNKWRARISVNGKERMLGYFTDITEAAHAYEEAARELHGEFFCNQTRKNSAA